MAAMRRLLPWFLAALVAGIVALVCVILPPDPAAVLQSNEFSSNSTIVSAPADLSDVETLRPDIDTRLELETPAGLERQEIALRGEALRTPAAGAPRGRVAGRVLGGWNGDSPLADASVTLWRSRARNPREHEGRTDANGNFALEGVAFAYWFAEMSAPGHRVVRLVVPVTPEEPTAAPVARLPFWRDIGVNLVNGSEPVTNVEQIGLRSTFAPALTLGIGPSVARSQSELKSWRRLGSFRGPEKFPAQDSASWRVKGYTQYGDCLHVLLGPHVVASHPLENVVDTIGIPVDLVAIQAALTRVSVRVVSGGGEPIAGAQVEFLFEGRLIEDVTADVHGLAVLRDVPRVPLMARARSPRHVPDLMTVEGDEWPHVIRLAAGWGISGRVEVPAGKPRSDEAGSSEVELETSVGLWHVEPESERLGSRIQKVTLRDGAFQFDPVLPGIYALSCGVDSVKNLRSDKVLNSPPAHVVVVQVTGHELFNVAVPWIEDVQAREARQRKGFPGRKVGGGR